MKTVYKNYSKLSDADSLERHPVLQAHNKQYYTFEPDSNGNHIRLTDCCAAGSTYHDDTLCCKQCWQAVPVGQGDGGEAAFIPDCLDSDAIESAYREAIAFTDTGDMDQPDSTANLDYAGEEIALKDIKHFLLSVSLSPFLTARLQTLETQAGHDLWLTRNGHGTGFWDNPKTYGEASSNELTAIAENMGESWVFETDDSEYYSLT